MSLSISLEDFLTQFAQALADLDSDRFVNFFPAKVFNWTASGHHLLICDEKYRNDVKNLFATYCAQGIVTATRFRTEINNLNSHYVVFIHWGLLIANGQVHSEFEFSYGIKAHHNSWKFIFIIDHANIPANKDFESIHTNALEETLAYDLETLTSE